MLEEQENGNTPWYEPLERALRLSVRLIAEAVPAAIFAGMHWVLRWWFARTGQEREWWAPLAMNFLAACFLLTLVGAFGSEAFIEAWGGIARAVRFVKRR